MRKSSSSGRDAGRGWANHRGEKIPLGCLSGPADMSPTPNATAERNGRWLDELPARVARMSVRETRWSRAKSLWPLGLGLLGMMTPKKVPCYQYYCQYWHPHENVGSSSAMREPCSEALLAVPSIPADGHVFTRITSRVMSSTRANDGVSFSILCASRYLAFHLGMLSDMPLQRNVQCLLYLNSVLLDMSERSN